MSRNDVLAKPSFTFNDGFLKKLEETASCLDDLMKRMHNVSKELDKDASYGLCKSTYTVRFITPADISTFVANLEKAISTSVITHKVGDCEMFSVASAKKFVEEHGCTPFDCPNSMGNRKGALPNGTTLEDLELLVAYEDHHSEVYSQYEMQKRIEEVKKDFKRIEDIHLTANIRALVKKIPDVIKNNSTCGEGISNEVLAYFIGRFMLFALRLAAMSVQQMLNYALPENTTKTAPHDGSVPKIIVDDKKISTSTVNGDFSNEPEGSFYKESTEFVQESINTEETHPVYFVFISQHLPVLSNGIRAVTKSDWTHVGISFYSDLHEIHSFGANRLDSVNHQVGRIMPGYSRESIVDWQRRSPNDRVLIVGAYVSNDKFEKLQRCVYDFQMNASKTVFNAKIIGQFLLRLDKTSHVENKYRQVCSTFCDYMMTAAGIKVTGDGLTSPASLHDSVIGAKDAVIKIYDGPVTAYRDDMARQSMKDYASSEKSISFDNYVENKNKPIESVDPNIQNNGLSKSSENARNDLINKLGGEAPTSTSQTNAENNSNTDNSRDDLINKMKENYNEGYVQESIDTDKKKPIYFVFVSEHKIVMSDLIRKITNTEWTHVGISFDKSLDKIHTFAQKRLTNKNHRFGDIGVGYTVESIQDYAKRITDDMISVVVTYVEPETVQIMKDTVDDFSANRHKTFFDWSIIAKYLFGKDEGAKPSKNKYLQVCSTFCDYIMAAANVKVTPDGLVSPESLRQGIFSKDDAAFEVYNGKAEDYNIEDVNESVKDFINSKSSKGFDDVITECYQIIKPDNVIRSKIPFNCNIRDIVLMDMHPEFKDTKSALHYILENPKSPINILIAKFMTTEEIKNCKCQIEADQVIRMFINPRRDVYDNNPYHMLGVQFPSDVNWLDKISYGNAYLDLNYRTDAVGNNNADPITVKLDMLYKLFGTCPHETDSKVLANNIIKIRALMDGIIRDRKYSEEYKVPRQLTSEILAVLGDIMTRCMLKLYYNNTIVIDASDAMNDTLVPGYLYTEAYIMEAETDTPVTANGTNTTNTNTNTTAAGTNTTSSTSTNTNTNTTNSNANKPTTITNNKEPEGLGKAKQTALNVIRAVLKWFVDTWNKLFGNFEKIHQAAINDLKKRANLNQEIVNALNANSLDLTLNNYRPFNVPTEELSKLSFTNHLESYLTGDKKDVNLSDPKNLMEFKKGFYPEAIADEVVKIQTGAYSDDASRKNAEATANKARGNKVSNYILYGQATEPEIPATTKLTAELFSDMVKQLNDSIGQGGIINICKNLGDEITKDLKSIEQKLNASTDEAEQARLKTIITTLNEVLASYVFPQTEALVQPQNGYWDTLYNLWRSIVIKYNDSKGAIKKAENTANTANTTNTANAQPQPAQ